MLLLVPKVGLRDVQIICGASRSSVCVPPFISGRDVRDRVQDDLSPRKGWEVVICL